MEDPGFSAAVKRGRSRAIVPRERTFRRRLLRVGVGSPQKVPAARRRRCGRAFPGPALLPGVGPYLSARRCRRSGGAAGRRPESAGQRAWELRTRLRASLTSTICSVSRSGWAPRAGRPGGKRPQTRRRAGAGGSPTGPPRSLNAGRGLRAVPGGAGGRSRGTGLRAELEGAWRVWGGASGRVA